ncbi:MAG: dephospho-CoA kinase [Pseudomonadota bacterium]|nr:dephospho-CoA kinase [Pseudomonadota bacterium]
MKKIGITGSVASGKSTASKYLSYKKGPLFSADEAVKKLYKNKNFKKIISKKLKIKNTNIKENIKEKIVPNKKSFKKLEKIIHPLVRKKMKKFIIKNSKKKILFFEIPLLIESNLMGNFDLIIFIKASKRTRLKRFVLKGGNKRIFKILDDKQLSDSKKIKFCDHVVINEKNKKLLKKKLSDIIRLYE